MCLFLLRKLFCDLFLLLFLGMVRKREERWEEGEVEDAWSVENRRLIQVVSLMVSAIPGNICCSSMFELL